MEILSGVLNLGAKAVIFLPLAGNPRVEVQDISELVTWQLAFRCVRETLDVAHLHELSAGRCVWRLGEVVIVALSLPSGVFMAAFDKSDFSLQTWASINELSAENT